MTIIEQIAVYGLVTLAVLVLGWSIYHAGSANQKQAEAQQDIAKAIEVEKLNNELRQQSNKAADDAIAAGDAAGPAPDDPDELPDEVRARILGRKR